MPKTIIFEQSFLISGIMCFEGCGRFIDGALQGYLTECKGRNTLPADAMLRMDAEPAGLGIHQLTISIETETNMPAPMPDLYADIKKCIAFDIIDGTDTDTLINQQKNWFNVVVNIMSMLIVFGLSLILPPSLGLTIASCVLTFITTAYTSRAYLFALIQNARTMQFATMATTIGLGWILSMAHTFYHAFSMPMAHGFSTVFMTYMMPSMLLACINGMDEIKRLLMETSKRMQLKGIKRLLPEMADTYACYPTVSFQGAFSSPSVASSPLWGADEEGELAQLLGSTAAIEQPRHAIREGMLLEVKRGECFPVDCLLVTGNTVIDASLLTGEPHQIKRAAEPIPSGAINLGQPVTVYALKNAYNSTVNQLLFRSNRAPSTPVTKEKISGFAYLYSALILMGLVAGILIPMALGIATVPLVMQNILGILFSVCPCTIAIAYELPKLISLHSRHRRGIQFRDEHSIASKVDDMHTIVFDKTGTLTTGQSVVESSTIDRLSPVWQRIYLLERQYGLEHPLARAIQRYYEKTINQVLVIDSVEAGMRDPSHRGLSALVQGKRLQIGSVDYLREQGIVVPEPDRSRVEQGFSVVCVAEEQRYQGLIYIKHDLRPGVMEVLTRLKQAGKKLLMLTGDNVLAAQGFNRQMRGLFEEADVHAGQTPEQKEALLKSMMGQADVNPQGVWFVGDGLNDAPCCRMVSEKGGVSCAVDATDKSAFFTDISLNGSLDYLFKHALLNEGLEKNRRQNKGILLYGALVYLVLVLGSSVAGMAVSPLIPMGMMLYTTMLVLFNAYRVALQVDLALDGRLSWARQWLASDVSTGLLLGAGTLFLGAAVMATLSAGALVCALCGVGLLGVFGGLLCASLVCGDGGFKVAASELHTGLKPEYGPGGNNSYKALDLVPNAEPSVGVDVDLDVGGFDLRACR